MGKALGLELAGQGTSELFCPIRECADFQGANVLLLARGKDGLEKAQKEMWAVRQTPTQVIDILCVDLTKPEAVRIVPMLEVWADTRSVQLP